MAKKWLVVMAMWLLGVAFSNAQELVWSVDFDSHFANREGGDELRPDQTFLFTRLAQKSAYSWAIIEMVTRSRAV